MILVKFTKDFVKRWALISQLPGASDLLQMLFDSIPYV